ncbi:hypothetical protein HN604_03375 [archaeon]|jgi:hypothetical protein|nr:hypothetical protein [archaeon]MBT6182375.1 hypothetical protein [archaeon]MBT6606540.1 hypothetical protein [archaeon]MBT7251833.1 hypothetical protein [archaeon]MBT7661095.1 hypothetical protein [archaeon]
MDLTNIWWVVTFVAAVWVIYDVWAKNERAQTGMKVVWTILALLFGVITAIIYYFTQKR